MSYWSLAVMPVAIGCDAGYVVLVTDWCWLCQLVTYCGAGYVVLAVMPVAIGCDAGYVILVNCIGIYILIKISIKIIILERNFHYNEKK